MTLGVVIGRFQVPFLTVGHRALVQAALDNHEKVLILIGVSDATGTDRNPLNFKVREKLFTENPQFFKAERERMIVKPLKDYPLSDKDWSEALDTAIEQAGFEEAVVYAGRDNSLESYYTGKHKIEIIQGVSSRSGTELREAVTYEPTVAQHCQAFREGIIHHVKNRYPIVYPTVDVAIVYYDETTNADYILMGKKGEGFSFVGGFVDKADIDYESAAVREVREETGIILDPENFKHTLNYIFSRRVEDLRYKNTKDSIMTMFFEVRVDNNELPKQENISDKEFKEFKWIKATKESYDLIAPTHKELFKKYVDFYFEDDTLEA